MSTDELWREVDAMRAASAAEPDGPVAAASAAAAAAVEQNSESATKARLANERRAALEATAMARVHNAICRQVHNQWLVHGGVYARDAEVAVCDAREACEPGVCQVRSDELRLYVIAAADETSDMIDKMRRQLVAPQLYLLDEDVMLALEKCGGRLPRRSAVELERRHDEVRGRRKLTDTSAFNCLVHACVERYCLLPPGANQRQIKLYNMVHARPLADTVPLLERRIHFCARHARFHLCDMHCDQTYVGRHNDRVCALSAKVKRAADNVLSFGEGTHTNERAALLTELGNMRDHVVDVSGRGDDAADAALFASEAANAAQGTIDAAGAKRRRRATASDVTIIRDRKAGAFGVRGGRRRGRGRGRGAIAGGSAHDRAAERRRRLAAQLARSSGDTLTGEEAERLAIAQPGAGLKAPGADEPPATSRNTSRKRKASRARRKKASEAASSSKLTVRVPLGLLCAAGVVSAERAAEMRGYGVSKPEPDAAGDGDGDGEGEGAGAGVGAGGSKADVRVMRGVVDADDCVAVAFDARAKVPFAERHTGQYDREFALDVLCESAERAKRFARFRISTLPPALNTFFDNSDLFEHYGERAAAIIWRLFNSHQRARMERNKTAACVTRMQRDMSTYLTAQRKPGHERPVLAERLDRIAREVRGQTRIVKQLVVTEELWLVLGTYWSLLVVEFYFNLISLPDELVQYLDAETSATIKRDFYFEHFVPAIVSALQLGISVNNVVILPCDGFVREWFPDSNTLKLLGMAEQTRTHLETAIASFLSAARSSHIPMRRFEATVLEVGELAALCIPGVVEDSEKMSTSERATAAARRTVELFLERRLRRLNSLGIAP